MFTHPSKVIQILPAPPEAKHPPQLIADHPFVIEIPVKESSNGFITNNHRQRKFTEWAWLLNAVLRASIKSRSTRQQQLWALCRDDYNASFTQDQIKWVQEFYLVTGFKSGREQFSAADVPELKQVPHEDYYSAQYVNTSDELEIPDNLLQTIDRSNKLSFADRQRFMRAIRWMSVANAVWSHHSSSAYIAQVIAVEALINLDDFPKKKNGEPAWGATKRFKHFLSNYVSTINSSEAEKLYKVRSDMVHGWNLFHFDESPWGNLVHHPRFVDDHDAVDQVFHIVRQVLINWLWK